MRENDRVENSVRFGGRADRDSALMIICGVAMLIRQMSLGPKEIGYRLQSDSPISAHLPHEFRADGGRLSTWIMPGRDAVPGLRPEVSHELR